MKQRLAGICMGLVLILGAAPLSGQEGRAGGSPGEPVRTFVLRDHLKREWRDELVTYEIPWADDKLRPQDLRLLPEGGGGPLPVQISVQPAQGDKPARAWVSFLASVAPLGTSTYRLVRADVPAPATDLKVQAAGNVIRIENGRVAVEVAADRQAAQQGPIVRVRLASGAWIGRGSPLPMLADGYDAEVQAGGPVFAEVAGRYRFKDGTEWKVKFRVITGQPVVLVDEEFGLSNPEAAWRLQINSGWRPDSIEYAAGGKKTELLPPSSQEDLYVLQPWMTGWLSRRGVWFGLYDKDGGDYLMIASRDASAWVRPLPRSMDPWTRTHRALDVDVPLRIRDDKLDLVFPFPRNGSARRWMIAALGREEALAAGKPELPRRLAIQYGQVPLDAVKDYVLEWPSREPHPRLYVTRDNLDLVRELVAKPAGARISDALRYAATGDQGIGHRVADEVGPALQACVDRFTIQSEVAARGDAPHVTAALVKGVINPADAILDGAFLAEGGRDLMRAQLAFLAYQMASPDVLSPARGWSANPNMTTGWYCALGELACLLASHPQARDWFDRAEREIKLELDTWAGPNGGWLEAPHYMAVAMDYIVPFAISARNSGFADFLYDVRLKRAMSYLARLSTPPDPDAEGRRLLPAVGNTYHGETSGLTAWMAALWAGRDAAYSQEMQWVWYQQGRPMHSCIGGGSPGLEGYWPLFADPNLPQRTPDWRTEFYPAVGVVFRSGFPSDREAYMFFRQGPFAEHWDHDEGMVVLYGRGRPLIRDWSYNPWAGAAWLHSRVVNNHSDGRRSWDEHAAVQRFAMLGAVQYARGRQELEAGPEGPATWGIYEGEWPFKQREPNGDMTWERQVLFVHEDRADRPAYFVLADTTIGKTWMEWCLWVCGQGPLDVRENPVRVKGLYDVDMDVFFAAPAKPNLDTLHAERTGIGPKIAQELIHLAQPAGTPVVVALYPYVRDKEVAARFRAIADGHGVRVEGEFGTDVNIVSRRHLRLDEGGIKFEGSVASVQDRADRVTLALPEGGSLAFGNYSISCDEPAAAHWAKDRREIRLQTDGRACQVFLTAPGDPTGWQPSCQGVLTVAGPTLTVSLPEGWRDLRLLAPVEP